MIVVGAPGERSSDGDPANDDAQKSGAAYVFSRTGSDWSQVEYLKAVNIQAGAEFGRSVAIDGNLIAVSAPDEDGTVEARIGAVYIYENQEFSAPARITALNPGESDNFGSTDEIYTIGDATPDGLSISNGRVLVGAALERSGESAFVGDGADNSVPGAGAAYLFEKVDAAWEQTRYLKASNVAAETYFGNGIALSGELAVVGSPGENGDSTGINNGGGSLGGTTDSGATYVFVLPEVAP